APLVHRHHGDAPGWRRWIAELGPFEVGGGATTPGKKAVNTVTGSLGELREQTVSPAPRRWPLVAGSLAAIAVAVVIVGWPRHFPRVDSPPPSTATTAPAPPQQPKTPPPAPAPVHLVVEGIEGGEIAVDGRVVG